jgi:hypothetical protein
MRSGTHPIPHLERDVHGSELAHAVPYELCSISQKTQNKEA